MLLVRAARPEDADDVARVHVRSWQAAYRGILADEYLDGLRPEDRAARYTFGSTDPEVPLTIVAAEDGVICGFATTGPSPDIPVRGELFALYVDPDAWGTGVGRRLIADARAHLHGAGYTEAALWVLDGNDRAQRFYRIDGWRPDGRQRRDEIWGVTVDEAGWVRPLP